MRTSRLKGNTTNRVQVEREDCSTVLASRFQVDKCAEQIVFDPVSYGLSPKLEKGFQIACDDLRPDRRFVVYGGSDRYPIKADVEVIGPRALADILAAL